MLYIFTSAVEFRTFEPNPNRFSNFEPVSNRRISVRVEDPKNSVSNRRVGFEIRRNSKVQQHQNTFAILKQSRNTQISHVLTCKKNSQHENNKEQSKKLFLFCTNFDHRRSSSRFLLPIVSFRFYFLPSFVGGIKRKNESDAISIDCC